MVLGHSQGRKISKDERSNTSITSWDTCKWKQYRRKGVGGLSRAKNSRKHFQRWCFYVPTTKDSWNNGFKQNGVSSGSAETHKNHKSFIWVWGTTRFLRVVRMRIWIWCEPSNLVVWYFWYVETFDLIFCFFVYIWVWNRFASAFGITVQNKNQFLKVLFSRSSKFNLRNWKDRKNSEL